MPFAIQPGARILFTGDSITDTGRRGEHAPIGQGYARIVRDLITIRYPERAIQVMNTGIAGNTALDLTHRWTDDVIRHQPDWLSILVGINDLHRVLRAGPDPVTPALYAELYDRLLERTRQETQAQIILLEPFYISQETDSGSFRKQVLDLLPEYLQVVHQMAKKHKTRLVKTHAMYQALLAHQPVDFFAPEPVHPNPAAGHLAMAHAWLKAVGW